MPCKYDSAGSQTNKTDLRLGHSEKSTQQQQQQHLPKLSVQPPQEFSPPWRGSFAEHFG
jgi:hypothetical protein